MIELTPYQEAEKWANRACLFAEFATVAFTATAAFFPLSFAALFIGIGAAAIVAQTGLTGYAAQKYYRAALDSGVVDKKTARVSAADSMIPVCLAIAAVTALGATAGIGALAVLSLWTGLTATIPSLLGAGLAFTSGLHAVGLGAALVRGFATMYDPNTRRQLATLRNHEAAKLG